ncbi:MAG: DNA/RNA nuclease SfsA [Amylibacter sp.]|jgi:sugar fermentation stimulation protein A|nr:DNA/RNA nuclease SfsA [Amylibacter sp.]|tara:strand:+ start:13464 stop:14174 length:711 start_codon:yes stop_codon:yes gene_type:complete
MKFESALIRGTLTRRYKRFLADVTLEDGSEITAHIANPGSMLGMAFPGDKIWLETNDDPKRKLKYSWKFIETSTTLIGVDTSAANRIVKEALQSHKIDLNYDSFKSEVKYGENSRVDFLLSKKNMPDTYLEVKSVTLSRKPGLAEFPDSKTIRGAKHMEELANMVSQGYQATVLFLVQRTDALQVSVAGDIDLNYQRAFSLAVVAGVQVLCYDCIISNEGITLGKRLDLANTSNSV